jgi:hypothetical protein
MHTILFLLIGCIYYCINEYPNKADNCTSYMNIDDIEITEAQYHSHPSRDSICTCKTCNHQIARDCLKSDCSCCKGTDHSLIMDGIEGFVSTSKKPKLG